MTAAPRAAADVSEVFPATSAIAARLREIPWAGHALGGVATWPQTLRTAVNLCLTSPHAQCVVWGASQTCIYNDAFVELGGVTPWAAPAASCALTQTPAWWARIKPLLKAAAQSGAVSADRDGALPGSDQNGQRLVRFSVAPVRQEDRKIGGFLVAVIAGANHDTASASGLPGRSAAADAQASAKDAFFTALSHELRTPLTPVLLLASEAAANAALPAAVRADFESIRRNVELEVRLIDDLLDFKRETDRNVPLNMGPVDLHAPLEAALAVVRAEIEAKHLRLIIDRAAVEPIVWGDEVRLQQAFWNLLKNAVKFTPHTGHIWIRTQIDAPRGLVLVTISDTGSEIATREQTQISKCPASGEIRDELGLGLTVSRIIVEMHAGRIVASNRDVTCGSRFSVELPLHHAPVTRVESAPASPLASAPIAPPKTPGRRMRVLLVEDHTPTRNTLALLLSRRDFEVLAAGSVAEARAFGLDADVQLVISDISLPDGDGYELMTALRASHPNLPGIAITGYGMEEDFLRSRRAGFGLHLIKPVNIAALEAAIACVFQPGAAVEEN